MNVYFKRVTTWQKWPDNDLVDEDFVEYSLSKKKWLCFHRTIPQLNMQERATAIATVLKVKKSNTIKLIRLYGN